MAGFVEMGITKEEYDQRIRNKTIDEYRRILCENAYEDYETDHLVVDYNEVWRIADQMKEGANVENNGWIPCSERMPNKEEYLKDDGRFIVTDGQRVYQSIYDIYSNHCFRTLQLNYLLDGGYASNFEVDKRVIAWQSLPAPFEKL